MTVQRNNFVCGHLSDFDELFRDDKGPCLESGYKHLKV